MPEQTAPTAPIIGLYPLQRGLFGPVTLYHIVRFLRIYLLILLLGFAFTQLALTPHWQIFGLGLMIPGGGFLAHANFETAAGLIHLATAFIAFLAFSVTVIGWFATGNAVAPPFAWLLLAVIAALMKHGYMYTHMPWITLLGILGVISASLLSVFILQPFYMSRRKAANHYLANKAPAVSQGFQENSTSHARELSPEDLKRMRLLLNRALQPLPEFNGFEWLDQFQTAAVRYQINFTGYALSMSQATYMPAFSGYIRDAQKNLIQKQTDHRIWKYWALENLWGNFQLNADPVIRENIMFTGFCATQMSMFHRASGLTDYNSPASFSLHHPSGKTYAYDLPSLIDTLERETQRSVFHLVACEPNWIYPLCNTIYAAAAKAEVPDTWAARAENFRDSLETEFISLKGQIIPCRSRYTGFALPNIGGAMPQALPCFFLNATMPDIALRQWLLLRKNILHGGRLNRSKFWRIDTGNYKFSRASAYSATALAAAEMGDGEIAKLCFDALDEECPVRSDNGFYHRPKSSVWSHATEFFARSAVKDGFRNLMTGPQNTAQHPHIEKADYPQTLVAQALYAKGTLNAVLYPGAAHGWQQIGLAGLTPHATYSCLGSRENSQQADNTGKALINILLDGRKVIKISKAS